MGLSQTDPDGTWVPQGCTLPASERPVRGADFDGLFAGAVRGVKRVGPARLRFDLQPSPQVAGRAAELVAAEAGCCSFFTFILTVTGGRLVLEVTVPASHIAVLGALADRAAAVTGDPA